MGWIEENDPTSAFIEPMGVHSDYRRHGLGKALAKECFKRLGALGVERVSIASNPEPDIANFLYDSLAPASGQTGVSILAQPESNLPGLTIKPRLIYLSMPIRKEFVR